MTPPAITTELVSVSLRRWVHEELEANSALPVRRSFGLDILSAGPGAAWWMPSEHAARLLAQGVPLTLSAPGPGFITRAAHLHPTANGIRAASFMGRSVTARRVDEIPTTLPGVFAKLAEAKSDTFPAAFRTGREIQADRLAAGIPDDSIIEWSDRFIQFGTEVRCYVLDGRVVASSPYLAVDDFSGQQRTYYDVLDVPPIVTSAAVAFAGRCTEVLSGRQPRGYVLDVGYDTGANSWRVVEANPAWCSAWYGCDIDAVVATIARSCQPDPGWEWRPDPYLTGRAARMAPLPQGA